MRLDFIEVHGAYGKDKIYINPEKIQSISRKAKGKDTEEETTEIKVGVCIYCVRETMDEVLDLIMRTSNNVEVYVSKLVNKQLL